MTTPPLVRINFDFQWLMHRLPTSLAVADAAPRDLRPKAQVPVTDHPGSSYSLIPEWDDLMHTGQAILHKRRGGAALSAVLYCFVSWAQVRVEAEKIGGGEPGTAASRSRKPSGSEDQWNLIRVGICDRESGEPGS